MGSRVDWEAIQRDYRTGKFSDGELAEKHALSRESIVRARKRDQAKDPASWAQDLGPQVRAATNALLMQEMVADKITEGHTKVTDVILVTAEANKQVVLGHRTALQRITAVAGVLMGQIEQAASQMADLSEVIEMVRNPDDNGVDKANDALRKAMTRPALVDDLKKLAEINERVIKGERQAFGLDDKEPPEAESAAAQVMTDAERAVRLYNLLQKSAPK